MRIHIMGICGTFMSGIALLAKQHGHDVKGSDTNVYPPMSVQLEQAGIHVYEGFNAANVDEKIDCVIIGNVIKRGNPELEYVLNANLPYTSGPQWLAENILQNHWVLAVAGTHGKTTTASMLAWILQSSGLQPGFLIGGVPENFGVSARLGRKNNETKKAYFVIEADEYDSAYFDKRSKFIHYRSKTLVLNNLEFDHADIFKDLDAIKQQFHYLVRTIPGNGCLIVNGQDGALTDVLQQGCWSELSYFNHSNGWHAALNREDGSVFTVYHQQEKIGEVKWDLLGQHNVANALAAIAASVHVGVEGKLAIEALAHFKNVKRRLQLTGRCKDIAIYDDFAHHPTAIAATLAGLRAKVGQQRIIAVLEFGSYTMRSGVHKNAIANALRAADVVFLKNTKIDWGLDEIVKAFNQPSYLLQDSDTIVNKMLPMLQAGDHVVLMSNTGFENIHSKLLHALGT